MSTIFNVRNLKLPSMSRAAVIIGARSWCYWASIAAFVGWQLYRS